MVNHPNWLTFVRPNTIKSNYPRVVIYINIRLFLSFSIRKDIIDHRDILLVSFFNNRELFWLMNIYSDTSHSTLKHLKDVEVNIWNLLIMIGNFNIRDNLWDPSFLHHSFISDNLIIITDSFHLSLSVPTHQISTRYADNINDSNLTIDLVFLQCDSPCYDLRLGSGCNLGKDLRKNKNEVQLVKCKDYRVVSMLYIQLVHEASVWSTWGERVIEHEDKARTVHLLHECQDHWRWTLFSLFISILLFISFSFLFLIFYC